MSCGLPHISLIALFDFFIFNFRIIAYGFYEKSELIQNLEDKNYKEFLAQVTHVVEVLFQEGVR